MRKFNEITNNLRALLKELTTADNATNIASLAKIVDEADEAYKAKDDELIETKSALVDFVKNTSFTKPNEEPAPQLPEEKSLDDIMLEELDKIK